MRRIRKGETLIEVLIAMALFSAAAVSVIGIMNHGVNNVQTSLETTMARSEIDSQAEALRFVQEAYASDKNVGGNNSAWRYIIENLAINPAEYNHGEDIVNCEKFYKDNIDTEDNNVLKEHVFVLNTRQLNGVASLSDAVVINQNSSLNHVKAIFEASPVNPRLVYGNEDQYGEDFYSDSDADIVSKAEGLWVVAVRDHDLDEETEDSVKNVDYLDFYVHTCWDSLGSVADSNIVSTIRLHNPDSINVAGNSAVGIEVTYYDGDNKLGLLNERSVKGIQYFGISENNGDKVFGGWQDRSSGYVYQEGDSVSSGGKVELDVVWLDTQDYCVVYVTRGESGVTRMPTGSTCIKDVEGATVSVVVPSDLQEPLRPGYRFKGWSSSLVNISSTNECNGYSPGVCVYPVWEEETVDGNKFVVELSWSSWADLDSYANSSIFGKYRENYVWTTYTYKCGWLGTRTCTGYRKEKRYAWEQKPIYHENTYFNKDGVSARLHNNDSWKVWPWNVGDALNEKMTLELKEDMDDVYYSVWSESRSWDDIIGYLGYSPNRNIGWAHVTVKQYNGATEVKKYDFDYSGGDTRCWNVFKIQDGNKLVEINQANSSAKNGKQCAEWKG